MHNDKCLRRDRLPRASVLDTTHAFFFMRVHAQEATTHTVSAGSQRQTHRVDWPNN